MKPVLTSTVLAAALSRLAAMHDLPELMHLSFAENEKGLPGSIIAKAPIQPRGQMSMLVSTLEATVQFCPYEGNKGLFFLQVNLYYTHPGGGSNGKTIDYVVLTDKYGVTVEFKDIILQSTYYLAHRGGFTM